MHRDKPKYWIIKYSPEIGERKSPHDYINNSAQRASLYLRLRTIEKIKIVREWPGCKPFLHNSLRFYQLTIGRHRVYIYLDTRDKRNHAIVCHVCPKVSQKAKKKDLDRATNHIRKYLQE